MSALFLACKFEEVPNRPRLAHVTQAAYPLVATTTSPDKQLPTRQECDDMAEEVVSHEQLLLETLGFDLTIKQPHFFIVKGVEMVGESEDLSRLAFCIAHNSYLLTTMCIQYSATVIACVCINVACRWKGIKIPRSSEGKHWWEYIDPLVSEEMLERLSDEFLGIYEKCPPNYRRQLKSIRKKLTCNPGKKDKLSESKPKPRITTNPMPAGPNGAPATSNHHPGDRPTVSQPSSSHKPAPGPLPASGNFKLPPLSGLKQSPSSSAGSRPDHLHHSLSPSAQHPSSARHPSPSGRHSSLSGRHPSPSGRYPSRLAGHSLCPRSTKTSPQNPSSGQRKRSPSPSISHLATSKKQQSSFQSPTVTSASVKRRGNGSISLNIQKTSCYELLGFAETTPKSGHSHLPAKQQPLPHPLSMNHNSKSLQSSNSSKSSKSPESPGFLPSLRSSCTYCSTSRYVANQKLGPLHNGPRIRIPRVFLNGSA